MKRADIVNIIAKSGKVDLDKRDIAKLVDSTFDMISKYLSEDIYENKEDNDFWFW